MPELKRFYFDDGRSRKRWQVRIQGKTLITEYGKISGALRESRKAFPSSAAASEHLAKLIAEKKREGYIEVDPSRLEIRKPPGRRKATEAQIKAFEKQIGSRLPEEYRHFLMTINGGHPNPDCVAVPGVEDIENVGVGMLFHLHPAKPVMDELSYETQRVETLLPKGHLPIAGSSDLFSLSLKPKTFGAVYWWFHETEDLDDEGNFLESAGYLLAASFDEFLTRIAHLHEGEENIEPAPPADSAGTSQKKPKPTIRKLLALVKHDHTPEKIKEIEQVAKALSDLSGIKDGDWPFINIDDPRIVRCLLEAGLNPAITDINQRSLLWQCAGSRECIDLLVEKSVNIHKRSGPDAETPLMRAIYLEAIPAVSRLIELGANPTLRLSWPIEDKLKRNASLQEIIRNASDKWRTTGQQTPQAISKPATASVKKEKPTLKRLLQLLQHDYIPEEFDEFEQINELITDLGDISGIQDGQWPKIDRFEDPRLLQSLLAKGLNPEITTKEGRPILNQCVMSPECIDLLVEKHVDINRPDQSGETPLMRATYKGDEECVKRLLAAGADPTMEFTSFARTMLNMKARMKAFIETARAEWNRNHSN